MVCIIRRMLSKTTHASHHTAIHPASLHLGKGTGQMLQALPATGPLSTPRPSSADIELKKPLLSCFQVHGPASVHRPTIRQPAYWLQKQNTLNSKQQGAVGIAHVAAIYSRMVGVGWSGGEHMQEGTWVQQIVSWQSMSRLSTFTARNLLWVNQQWMYWKWEMCLHYDHHHLKYARHRYCKIFIC